VTVHVDLNLPCDETGDEHSIAFKSFETFLSWIKCVSSPLNEPVMIAGRKLIRKLDETETIINNDYNGSMCSTNTVNFASFWRRMRRVFGLG
jgi:hypothetical protein